jgi:hypothetical protein
MGDVREMHGPAVLSRDGEISGRAAAGYSFRRSATVSASILNYSSDGAELVEASAGDGASR